jgi:Flp pilus assembly protein TadD
MNSCCPRIAARLVLSFAPLLLLCFPASAQQSTRGPDNQTIETNPGAVKICVRDPRGLPLDASAMVRLHSTISSYDVRNATQESSTATFPHVKAGEYEVEVQALGFKTANETITAYGVGGDLTVYVYLQPESSDSSSSAAPKGLVMTPKLQSEIEKGLVAIRKQQYDTAELYFTKASKLAPSNPDVIYLLGTVEMALHHPDLARNQFESALKLEPSNVRTLLSLGELLLNSGEIPAAIATLEKAYDVNGADWRVHYLLATAYARAGRLPEAEAHAARGASLAREKGAFVTYLLGEIQFAEHKIVQARDTWRSLLVQFPTDAVAAKAKARLASTEQTIVTENYELTTVNLPMAAVPSTVLDRVIERPWAPPDIDGMEYRVADNASCNVDEVLARADARLQTQLKNFEKFTATERIEHQEVDRYGIPGPMKSREFSYIVFVRQAKDDSVYLDEDRLVGNDLSKFPTSLATVGLNSLGVSVLQAFPRTSFDYKCEGLGTLRGQAAWQIRFEERNDSSTSLRQWRKNGEIVDIPLKGRLWLTTTSFDLLRIETDLTKPIPRLELTRDHLIVDYGPVDFEHGRVKLWLPWSAEMFMELHGKRHHHKHYLTNYFLFAVDTDHKIAAPKAASSANPEPNP